MAPRLRARWLVAAAAAAAIAALTISLTPAHAANLLVNPGFETGTMSGWSCSNGSIVTSPVHTGSRALKGGVTSSDHAKCTQTVTVQPNTTYALSAWVRGNYVYLGVTGGPSTWTPAAASYTQLHTSFTTGASQTSAQVYLHGWYAQGDYYADDVNLDGPGGSDPTPTASPTQSPSPTASPSPSPTGPPPSDPPPADLPKHTLTGYWHNFINGSVALRLRDVSSHYDVIAVAFAEADSSRPGAVTFTVDPQLSSALGGYSDADLINDVRTLHSRGKKVVISVGGERGNVIVNDPTSAANFASSVHGLMTKFGFDGVDIDLEHGINVQSMTSALRQLSAKAGAGMILTMAPQTIDMQSTSGSYFQLALNLKDILTTVHTQYYNSGTMLGCDNQVYAQGTVEFLTALACIQLENGLRPDQVALGLPASSRAAGGGYVDPSVVNRALDCLARGTNCGRHKPPRTYPSIRGAMTWSINWDRVAGNSFSNTVAPHLDTLP